MVNDLWLLELNKSKRDMSIRAYSYLRFSSPEQIHGDSMRRQTELALNYAAQNGLILDDTLCFEDKGISAYRGLNAQIGALKQFLEYVEAGLIESGSYLLVESLDRISRDEIISALDLFLQIIEGGITLVTLIDNRKYNEEIVNANPTELLISLLIMMRAREESATKSKRLKAAWDEKRANIRYKIFTRNYPAWINYDEESEKFELIEQKADVIKMIFRLALKGMSNGEIARTLNRKKVPSFNNSYWVYQSVYKLINNPAVTGTIILKSIEHMNGKKRATPIKEIPEYFPKAITKDVFDKVNGLRNRYKKVEKKNIKNLLGFLVKCPLCHSSMSSNYNQPLRLVCMKAVNSSECTYKIIFYDQLENSFLKNIDKIVTSAPNIGLSTSEELIKITAEIIKNKEVVEKISHSHLSTKPSAKKRIREAEFKIRSLLKRKSELIRSSSDSAGFKHRLNRLLSLVKSEPLDRGQINVIVRKLFRRVIVDYSRGNLIFEWIQGGTTVIGYSDMK